MRQRSVFQELSRYLPEAEREALLKKLKRRLSVSADEDDRQYHKELNNEDRDHAIAKDLEELGLFSKILLWFRAKLTAKSMKAVYLASRIRKLKRAISMVSPGITGFETRDLNPRLAEQIFSVYSSAVPVRRIYGRIWTKTEYLERMLFTLVRARYPEATQELTELVPEEDLEKRFAQARSKDALRSEVLARLDAHTKAIPDELFSRLETDLEPLLMTRDIVLYPYMSFFQLFHFTPQEEDLGQKTSFKSASAMLCLEQLERLHHALEIAAAEKSDVHLPEDVLRYIAMLRREEESRSRRFVRRQFSRGEAALPQGESGVSALGEIFDDPDPDAEATVQKLVQRSVNVLRAIPFELLLRYFLKDPYYELVVNRPELGLRDLYVSVIRLRFLAEVERIYPRIRRRAVEKEIAELFEGKAFTNFHNYREYRSIDYTKMGLPFFRHTRSITLLYNYVHLFYRGYAQEAAQILERNVLNQHRVARDNLRQHTAMIEDIEQKIRQFDYTLSPDSEDGRLFQRLRFAIAQDVSQHKLFRTLVVQKDREVQALLDRGVEALKGLVGAFASFLADDSETMKEQLQNHYFVRGRPIPLQSLLDERVTHMKRFLELINYIIKLENG